MQKPLSGCIGASLRTHRRKEGLTQKQLAAQADCSLPSVVQADAGRGGSAMFLRLAECLGLEVAGGHAGLEAIGTVLAAARRARRLSVRTVAGLAGVTPATVAAMERGVNTHLAKLASVAAVVGADLELRQASVTQPAAPAPDLEEAAITWSTPSAFRERLYPIVGGRFDLDPCSPTTDPLKAPIRARVYLTVADDGLSKPWFGCVYCNPPYGTHIGLWMAKCRWSVEHGLARFVLALVPARVDTKWWHENVAGHADIFMLKGRLTFGGALAAAPFPSALLCFGAPTEVLDGIARAFPTACVRSAARG